MLLPLPLPVFPAPCSKARSYGCGYLLPRLQFCSRLLQAHLGSHLASKILSGPSLLCRKVWLPEFRNRRPYRGRKRSSTPATFLLQGHFLQDSIMKTYHLEVIYPEWEIKHALTPEHLKYDAEFGSLEGAALGDYEDMTWHQIESPRSVLQKWSAHIQWSSLTLTDTE